MKPYKRPSYDASLDELNAALDQLDNDIYNGDRRAVDCCEEMNRLERALSRPRSPETPFPEGI